VLPLGDARYPVETLGKVPPIVGQCLLAAVTPEVKRHTDGAPLPCTIDVYLKTGASAHAAYGISGGP
jgi:hypothetical protein